MNWKRALHIRCEKGVQLTHSLSVQSCGHPLMMFGCAQFWRVLNIWMHGSGRGLAPSINYALVHQLIFPDVASLGWRPHLWHFSSHCTDNDWPIADTRRRPFGRSVDWVQWSQWFAPSQWETALLCNDVSHWLGANLESVLWTYTYLTESIPMLGTTSGPFY